MPDTESIIEAPYRPTTVSGRARHRRWDMLAARFPDIGAMRVVDLGGDARHWETGTVRPAEVVLVNLFAQDDTPDWITSVIGDACELPDALRGERFDLVYSNSTIEHVGGHARRAAFADVVHTLGDAHWIQTPYRYFPVEPHWWCPGFQVLPLRARVELMRRWPFGPAHQLWRERFPGDEVRSAEAFRSAVDEVLWIEVLSKTAMRHYFPGSELVHERMLGLTKSLIAVRGAVDR